MSQSVVTYSVVGEGAPWYHGGRCCLSDNKYTLHRWHNTLHRWTGHRSLRDIVQLVSNVLQDFGPTVYVKDADCTRGKDLTDSPQVLRLAWLRSFSSPPSLLQRSLPPPSSPPAYAYVFIQLHINAQPGPYIQISHCYTYGYTRVFVRSY